MQMIVNNTAFLFRRFDFCRIEISESARRRRNRQFKFPFLHTMYEYVHCKVCTVSTDLCGYNATDWFVPGSLNGLFTFAN